MVLHTNVIMQIACFGLNHLFVAMDKADTGANFAWVIVEVMKCAVEIIQIKL